MTKIVQNASKMTSAIYKKRPKVGNMYLIFIVRRCSVHINPLKLDLTHTQYHIEENVILTIDFMLRV